jgi:4-aminobutyrate aminotransferase
LLLIGCGYKAIRFLPPLDVRKREIDLALEILEETFGEAA